MLLAFVVALLLGTFPAAWLVVHLRVGQDVSEEGSGNVGAFNALRVSRSIGVGVIVVLLDAAKGAAAVWLATRLGAAASGLHLQCAAAVGVVLGHDYNPWLSLYRGRLTGGKGFAAAAGAYLVFRPMLVPCWLAIGVAAWFGFRALRGIRDEAPASAVATLLLLPAAWLLHDVPTALTVGAHILIIAPKLLPEVLALLRAPA